MLPLGSLFQQFGLFFYFVSKAVLVPVRLLEMKYAFRIMNSVGFKVITTSLLFSFLSWTVDPFGT